MPSDPSSLPPEGPPRGATNRWREWLRRAAIAALLAAPLGLMLYKVLALGYSLEDILPRARYAVSYDMKLDGHGGDVRLRTFLPLSDEHQTIGDERNSSSSLRFNSETQGQNRVATWSGGSVPDGTRVHYEFAVMTGTIRYRLDDDLAVPLAYPPSLAAQLTAEKDIQADDPAVRAALARVGADRGTLTARLRRIFDFAASLKQRPFKGTTDALTALRLGEASCNGKSRLFVALSRAAGIPARLVGGLILGDGRKRTSHQWAEAYVAGHWVPFCTTNRHFAELPERYLVLYRGDETLFHHTSDINFDYAFTLSSTMVPSPRARESFKLFNVWALFERVRLPFSLLRTVLMLPVGALVVVLFRNVVGLATFGTFLPALLAAAAGETGAGWGVVGILCVMAAVGVLRLLVGRLELLHSPTLAILLAGVTLAMLGTSLLAERLGLMHLTRVSFFPIAVLAIASERFYLGLVEHGSAAALKELGGTLVVVLCCYVVMNSLALQVLVSGFPEVLLLVVAADVYLGRWVGVRLFEYVRFRSVLWGQKPA